MGYNKNDPATIQSMFNSIAKRYDLTNAVLSLQMHKRWNRALVEAVGVPAKSETLLDLCSGTGDIALAYLQAAKPACTIYLVDFSAEMLACAKEKCKALELTQHRLEFIEADVQALPLLDAVADSATIAYGIRNVKDPAKCFREVFRTLKLGGRFGILELTQPTNPVMRFGHSLYLRTMLPLLGKWLTANQEAYDYLRGSIHTFITPTKLEMLLQEAGFINTYRKPLGGGIATILFGQKPY